MCQILQSLPVPSSLDDIISSKSVPSPSLLSEMISRFSSNTDIPVPSKATRAGSFCDLNRKKTQEDMMSKGAYTRQVNGGMNTRRGTPRAKLCKSASGRQRVLVRIVNPGCAASAI